jgi:hypothetical protein
VGALASEPVDDAAPDPVSPLTPFDAEGEEAHAATSRSESAAAVRIIAATTEV